MARRTVFVGAFPKTLVDTVGVARQSWPDIDTKGILADLATVAQFKGARAIALNPETDWDIVRVYFSGRLDAPELLCPGRVLDVPPESLIKRFEPVIAAPATRLYPASQQLLGDAPSPLVGAKWKVELASSGSAFQFKNVSGVSQLIYNWQDDGLGNLSYVTGDTIANNGHATAAAGSVTILANGAALAVRAADYSPDGIYNFADFMESGAITFTDGTSARGLAFVSQILRDDLGNPGDATNPTTKKYAFQFAPLSPLFFGRLAIDVFDEACVDYPPRLAPARQITFGAIALTLGAGVAPDTPIITFPTINAAGVEFLFSNPVGSGANIFAQLVSPLASDAITGIAGVPDAPPPPAAQFVTIPAGQEGSLVLDQAKHPFCKLVLGCDHNVTIPAGAMLTIKRHVTQ